MSTVASPHVVVAIAAYNAGPYLVPAIRSALEQTYDRFSVVVVDDGGTDGSVDEAVQQLSDPRLRFIRQENAGKSAALNRVLDEADGDFLCILDSDDIAHPERLARLVDEVRRHPDVGGVMSGFELILNDEPAVAPLSEAKDEARCARDVEHYRMPSHDPTLMVRMDLAKRLRFDPELQVGQGYDFILRLGEQWPIRVVPDVLYGYRVRSGSATRSNVVKRVGLQHDVARRAAVRRGLVATEEIPVVELDEKKLSNRRRDNNLANHFTASVRQLRFAGRSIAAIRTALRCIRLQPRDPLYYRPFVLAALPLPLLRRVVRQR
ncbi:MAG: glycosyltransferase family A protein [Planctomycetota bacterium]